MREVGAKGEGMRRAEKDLQGSVVSTPASVLNTVTSLLRVEMFHCVFLLLSDQGFLTLPVFTTLGGALLGGAWRGGECSQREAQKA